MNAAELKKQPYTGDPNAVLTICAKKMRRHLPMDFAYIPTLAEPDPVEGEEAKPKVKFMIQCRHCKQDPVLAQPNAVDGAAI